MLKTQRTDVDLVDLVKEYIEQASSSGVTQVGGIDLQGIKLDVTSAGLPAQIAEIDLDNFHGFNFKVVSSQKLPKKKLVQYASL